MKITAHYDQTFRRGIWDKNGNMIATTPLTHHFIFKDNENKIAGGFYLSAGEELPKEIKVEVTDTKVKLEIPAFEFILKVKSLKQEEVWQDVAAQS